MVFQPGDLVWLHLRKERFPTKRHSKLAPRGDGPFKVLHRINDNAYVLDLPEEYGVSTTFNVGDLSPYEGDSEQDENSGSNSFQEGVDDVGPSHGRYQGPITRARAKEIQEVTSREVLLLDTMREPFNFHTSCVNLLVNVGASEPSKETMPTYSLPMQLEETM